MKFCYRVLFSLMVLVASASSVHANTQLQEQIETLNYIAQFADNFCKNIPLEGSDERTDLIGKAVLELEGLLKKLTNIGIFGTLNYSDGNYKGLLREQLVIALKDSTKCRLVIWGDLKKMLISSTSPRQVDIIETNRDFLHLEDINCFKLIGEGSCDFWVTWAAPKPGMQAIIRVGENDEGYFACGSKSNGINSKHAPWATTSGPTKLRYYQVPATGPNYGCTDKKPTGAPVAESVIQIK